MAGTETSNPTNTSNRQSDGIVPCDIGQVVLVKGEKIIGVVSYKGTVNWDTTNRLYIGLTLSDPVPNGHNGSERGHKYFICPDKHGLIISSHLVSRIIPSRELLLKVTTLNHAFKQSYNQSLELQRKYIQIAETLQRVEGENQTLRDRLEYYENRNPYISNKSYGSRSPSPTPNSLSPSPSPNSRMRSKSNALRRRTLHMKALPPLPTNKYPKSAHTSPKASHMQNEPDGVSFGMPTPMTTLTTNISSKFVPTKPIHKHQRRKRRKNIHRHVRSNSGDTYKSFKSKSRKSSYKSRKSSYKSFKGRGRNRNISDISRSTMQTNTNTNVTALDSPMPLSIGDTMGGTILNFKMLAPLADPFGLQKSYSNDMLDILHDANDESESHDFHETNTDYTGGNTHRHIYGQESESVSGLFSPQTTNTSAQKTHSTDSPSISTRQTNTPKSYGSNNYGQSSKYINKFVPRDMEDIDDDAYNEENDLELGSVGASMNNIHERDRDINVQLKVPQIIDENNEMTSGSDSNEVSVDMEMNEESESGTDHSVEYTNNYEQMDEDSDLEIETPNIGNDDVHIGIPPFKPDHGSGKGNGMVNGDNNLPIIGSKLDMRKSQSVNIVHSHDKKPLPVLPYKGHSEHSHHNGQGIMGNEVSDIPNNIGLRISNTYIEDNQSALLSDTQSSARYSTPSYTTANTHMTASTISPQKTRNFSKRLSHTPAPIHMPGQFNPGKKFSSVPSPPQHNNNNISNSKSAEVFAAQDILDQMNPHSHSMKILNTMHSHSGSDQRLQILNNMIAHSHSDQHIPVHINMYGHNDNSNFHKSNNINHKRKSVAIPSPNTTKSKNNRLKRKKKVIKRSRTFVSKHTNGHKFDCLETAKQLDASTLMHQREATPDLEFAEQKSYKPMSASNTPIMTPQTVPLHSSSPHQLVLDDFELDEIHKHNINNVKSPRHQQYYSRQIMGNGVMGHTPKPMARRHSNVPGNRPLMSVTQSEIVKGDFYTNKKKLPPLMHKIQTHNAHRIGSENGRGRKVRVRKSMICVGSNNRRKRSTDHSPSHRHRNRNVNVPQTTQSSSPRNLGSLTSNELKGLLESDNLFSYDNYQKMIK